MELHSNQCNADTTKPDLGVQDSPTSLGTEGLNIVTVQSAPDEVFIMKYFLIACVWS